MVVNLKTMYKYKRCIPTFSRSFTAPVEILPSMTYTPKKQNRSKLAECPETMSPGLNAQITRYNM